MSIEFGQESQSTLGENSEILQTLAARSGIQTQTIGHQILSRSKFEVDQWRDKITQIIADDGELLLKYIPSLVEVVGPIPPRHNKQQKSSSSTAKKKNPNNSNKKISQSRKVSQLLCKFLTAIAGSGHPLLLVLDSMQWANQQLLQLFFTLSSIPGFSHVLFILSFRSDSQNVGNEKLDSVLKHCEQRNLQMTRHTLGNLCLSSIKELIEDAIGVSPTDSILPLAKIIERKTCGNPLFVHQFLRSLYQEQLLKFDDLQRKWIWDADKIQKKPYTPNVIKFMIHEIDKLSIKQRELLQLASCIGTEFDLETLTKIINQLSKINNEKSSKSSTNLNKKQQNNQKQQQQQQQQQQSLSPGKRKRPRTEYKIIQQNSLENENDEECSVDDVLQRCLFIAERDLLSVIVDRSDEIAIKGFAFTHEQIHKAAYQSQKPKEAAKIHLLIGKYWLEEFQKPVKKERLSTYERSLLQQKEEKNINKQQQEKKEPAEKPSELNANNEEILLLRDNEEIMKNLPPYRIIRQLNHGRLFIKDQVELMKLVEYNLAIVRNSIEEEATEQAVICATVAIELLERKGEKIAWKSYHKIMMELYVALYEYQNHEESELFDKLLQLTRSKLEKVNLYTAKVDHYRHLNKFNEAIHIAKICIREILKIPLFNSPTIKNINEMHLNLKENFSLDDLQSMTKHSLSVVSQFNGKQYAEEQKHLREKIQRLLSRCIDLTFQSNYLDIIQLAIQSSQWSFQWGITEDSLPGLIIYGVSCIHLFKDISYALKIEKLLISLDEKYPQKKYFITQSRLEWFHFWHNHSISNGIHSINCMEEELWDCYRDYISCGKIFYASHILSLLALNSYYTCENIKECSNLLITCSEYSQSTTSSTCNIIIHSILSAINSLSGTGNNNNSLDDQLISSSDFLTPHSSISDYSKLFEYSDSNFLLDATTKELSLHYCIQMQVNYLLGEVAQSHKAMQFINQNINTLFGRIEKFYFHFYSSLILCAAIETFRRIHGNNNNTTTVDSLSSFKDLQQLPQQQQLSNDSRTVIEYISQIDENLNEMIIWGELSPINFSHCIDLIKAEKLRIEGNYSEACDIYRLSINGARINKFILHEAIAHEQLGKLMILMGKKSPARYCLLDAIRCYKDWGAKNKLLKLEIQYKSLLQLNQHQKDEIIKTTTTNNQKNLISDSNSSNPNSSVNLSSNSSSLNSSSSKRMENQLKLLNFINEELYKSIGLGSCLKNSWKEICVFTAAERGCLALYRRRQLFSEITNDKNGNIKVLQSLLINNKDFCVSVMNYVTTSKTSVIIDDCLTDPTFLGDPYVREKKIRSLYCIPIIIHNNIIGVFYLENSLISGLFSDVMTPIMNTIVIQLTMVITNDQLASSLSRQKAENSSLNMGLNNFPGNQSGSSNPSSSSSIGGNHFKSITFRRIDHLLGYSWEKCLLVLTENHVLIHEPEASKNSQPLCRYSIDSIQQVDQVESKEIVFDSSTPPTNFILRIYLNNKKLKLYFAMNDLQNVKEWIRAISICLKQQPNDFTLIKTNQLHNESIDRSIKLWEDEIELVAVIGRGATSCVYSATWHGMRVAVKMFFLNSYEEDEESEFIKEVRILQNIRHPSIILFIGAYLTKEGPCVVTELMNVDLFKYLKTQKEIDISVKISWAKDITNGMVYLHSFVPPIVHRDLKSMNILLDENLKAKVADLGLARYCDRFMTNQLLGTPAWMAPEIFEGNEYTASADGLYFFSFGLNNSILTPFFLVYSFGIILWEIFSGEEPFKQITFSVEIGKQVCKGLRPTIPEDCPEAWSNLMRLCWSHDANSRPSFQQILHYIQTNS